MSRADKRSFATEQALKDALLEVMARKRFHDATVAEVCRTAGTSRSTFYLHYRNLSDTLDAILEDCFENLHDMVGVRRGDTEESCGDCPLCERVRNAGKYAPIFDDDLLVTRVVDKIIERYQHTFVGRETARGRLTPEQATAILVFQISGCYAVARASRRAPGAWDATRETLDAFIVAGLEAPANRRMPPA